MRKADSFVIGVVSSLCQHEITGATVSRCIGQRSLHKTTFLNKTAFLQDTATASRNTVRHNLAAVFNRCVRVRDKLPLIYRICGLFHIHGRSSQTVGVAVQR